MKLEIAEAIVEAGEHDGLTLITDYSGRGMYGRKTAAVVYPSLPVLLAAIALAAVEGNEKGEQRAEELAVVLRKVSTDSLGRDGIVY